MTVNVYINDRRIEDYPPEELEQLKLEINIAAFKAIGYVRKSDKK